MAIDISKEDPEYIRSLAGEDIFLSREDGVEYELLALSSDELRYILDDLVNYPRYIRLLYASRIIELVERFEDFERYVFQETE